jgi:hypothetical protein
MSWDDARRTLELNLAPGSRLLPPMPRSIDVHLLGQKQSKSFQGKPVQSRSVEVDRPCLPVMILRMFPLCLCVFFVGCGLNSASTRGRS